MTSLIDASSEQQPCEDFIIHSKNISCTMAEVSQEFDKFYDAVKKKFIEITLNLTNP